ncbi:MAG: fused MFS/spermidine synthase [Desulfarculus sp.]|nr:fused MFS/spermidine synthase [Desulfarculus sp.]
MNPIFARHRHRRPRPGPCLALLALLLLCWPAGAPAAESGRMLFEADSLYHHIMVIEAASGLRYLSFNRAMGHQSAVMPGRPEVLTFAYTQSAFAALAFLEREPQEVLFVGLGGGSMPMYLRLLFPQARMDIAEIDPEVVRVAEKYLSFKADEGMKVAVNDGRLFMKRNPQRYDLIFLDAYNDHAVPFHLTTREFLELTRSRLKPGGVVASNVWSQGLNRYFTAQIKTYQEVFPQLYLLQAGGGANYIFIATQDARQVSAEQAEARARALAKGRAWSFDLAARVKSEYACFTGRRVEDKVLTDDFAPVNLLRNLEASAPGEGRP